MFDGRIAIVTGAASGIGRGIASRLAADGTHVVVTDIDGVAAQAVAHSIEAETTAECVGIPMDVRDLEQVESAVRVIADRWGGIDILVNNAGVNVPQDIRDIDDVSWTRVLSTNLSGPYRCTRASLPYMKDRGGVVVNVSSPHAVRAGELVTSYATSKAGLIGLTRSCAIDCARFGVRVIAILPGTIDTPLVWSGYPQEEWALRRRIFESVHPIGRMGTTEDVAALVAFLTSSEAGFLTGSAVAVDGGLLASML